MNIKFFHVGNHTTYACELNEQRQVVAFATAKVHPKDQFCRRTGRVKAEGRLHSGRYRTYCLDKPLYEDFRDQEFNAFDLEQALKHE